MAPGVVEAAAQSNEPPSSASGNLSPSQEEKRWTPDSVLSTLKHRPEIHSSSPLAFFHLIERLKTTKREGWRRFGFNDGESISDHMYRMSIITMLCPPTLATRLDIAKCTKMALVHDMAESLVGDITPVDGVSKVEKSRRESETMDYLCNELLGNVDGGEAGRQMRSVWQEYEDASTLESKFVHDVDKMELLLQMLEYERSVDGRVDVGEFTYVAGRICLPEVQAWAADLLAERRSFWAEKGKVPSEWASIFNKQRQRQQDEYYGNGNGTVEMDRDDVQDGRTDD